MTNIETQQQKLILSHNTPGAVFSDLSELVHSPNPNPLHNNCGTKSEIYRLHSSISVYCSEQASRYN